MGQKIWLSISVPTISQGIIPAAGIIWRIPTGKTIWFWNFSELFQNSSRICCPLLLWWNLGKKSCLVYRFSVGNKIKEADSSGYYSISDPLGQRSQYISIKFFLHKQSEILGCATNQDMLLLTTLQYSNPPKTHTTKLFFASNFGWLVFLFKYPYSHFVACLVYLSPKWISRSQTWLIWHALCNQICPFLIFVAIKGAMKSR